MFGRGSATGSTCRSHARGIRVEVIFFFNVVMFAHAASAAFVEGDAVDGSAELGFAAKAVFATATFL